MTVFVSVDGSDRLVVRTDQNAGDLMVEVLAGSPEAKGTGGGSLPDIDVIPFKPPRATGVGGVPDPDVIPFEPPRATGVGGVPDPDVIPFKPPRGWGILGVPDPDGIPLTDPSDWISIDRPVSVRPLLGQSMFLLVSERASDAMPMPDVELPDDYASWAQHPMTTWLPAGSVADLAPQATFGPTPSRLVATSRSVSMRDLMQLSNALGHLEVVVSRGDHGR